CVGTCDGTNPLSCKYPGHDLSCGGGCASAAIASCDGAGACSAATPCPGNFACASATACRSTCTSASDCAGGYICIGGSCSPSNATCSTDGTASIPSDPSQPAVQCNAYACNPANGLCYGHCTDSSQCAKTAACGSGVCIASSGGSQGGGCGVRARGDRGNASAPIAALTVALLAGASRRRRARGRPRIG
ncbi:MAG: hypothetical protein ACHREM_20605, partial [Polyangiales bacterium]